jgi:hypothetical protein
MVCKNDVVFLIFLPLDLGRLFLAANVLLFYSTSLKLDPREIDVNALKRTPYKAHRGEMKDRQDRDQLRFNCDSKFTSGL